MEVEMEVICDECGEKFRMRFDKKEADGKVKMGFCPSCQRHIKVTSREFSQIS